MFEFFSEIDKFLERDLIIHGPWNNLPRNHISWYQLKKKGGRANFDGDFVNLLRWNDVPHTSRIFCPKIAIFSQFWVYLNIT